MVVKLNLDDGEVTTFKGGVAHVVHQPEDPPAAEAPVPQVLGPDPLVDAVHAIESLPDEATALAKAKELVLQQGFNKFELGGVLHRMKENHWFGGHATFGELCEHEFGFSQAHGYRLKQVYNALSEVKLTWAEVEGLGWRKVALMCSKLPPEEISTRVEEFKALTYLEAENKLAEEAGTPQPKPKTLTFKPHADQLETIEAAIEKAKQMANTEVNTVALEYLCLDFLPSPKPKGKPAAATDADKVLVARLKALGITETLNLLAELDPVADPEQLVVDYLTDTGVVPALKLFERAFPDVDIEASESI